MNNKSRLHQRFYAILLAFIISITIITPSEIVQAISRNNSKVVNAEEAQEPSSSDEGQDQTSNSDIDKSLLLKYTDIDGNAIPLINESQIPDFSKIKEFYAQYRFDLKDKEHVDGSLNRSLKGGDYYIISLPKELSKLSITSGVIYDNAAVEGSSSEESYKYTIAKWELINDNKIKVQFTDYINNENERYNLWGTFNFKFSIDLSSVEDGDITKIYFPIDNVAGIEISVTKPAPPSTTPAKLVKTVHSYDQKTRTIVWKVTIEPEDGIFEGCTLTDELDIKNLELASVKHGNTALLQGTDYQYDKKTGKLTYEIPEGRNGKDFKDIFITTTVKTDVYAKLTSTTISNTATLSGGQSDINISPEDPATKTITPAWLEKKGTVYQGNKIKWTINANVSEQRIYDAVITDRLQKDLLLDTASVEVNKAKINIYTPSTVPSELDDTTIYGVYTTNEDETAELKVYLPRGKDNSSNNTYTITIITDIKLLPNNPEEINPVYNNDASIEAKYVDYGEESGDSSIYLEINKVGVAFPHVTITKSGEMYDRSKGTIKWTMKAASNHSNYGKARIVDTLPDGLTFVEDEIYINGVKVSTLDNVEAEIINNNKTLILTFHDNKALEEEQIITVITKVEESIYGANMSRDFTNIVRASIYSESSENPFDWLVSTDTDSATVRVANTVITKANSAYAGNLSKDGENPKVNFTILINHNKMPLKNVVVTDDLNKIITEFKKSGEDSFNTISDARWTYIEDSVIIKNSSGVIYEGAETSYDKNSNYLQFDFGEEVEIKDKYSITFTAELDIMQNSIFKENGVIRINGNQANIEAQGLKPGIINSNKTATSGEIQNIVLGKSGVQLVKEQEVMWTININQHRVSLDNPVVEDILPLGLTLDPSSIKLYKNVIDDKGNFISGDAASAQGIEVDFAYDYILGTDGRYTLTVELPDNETSYILRFATDIDDSILGTIVKNEAYYTGTDDSQKNTTTSTVSLSSSASGGSTTKTSITVFKLNKDKYDFENESKEKVGGATFALYWLRSDSEEIFVRSLQATSGAVTFKGLTIGQKYKVVETSAPEGYLLDSENSKEFIATDDNNNEIIEFYNTPIKTATWTPKAIKLLSEKNLKRPFQFELRDEQNILIMEGSSTISLNSNKSEVNFTLVDEVSPEDILSFKDDTIFELSAPLGTEHKIAEKAFFMQEVPSKEASSGYEYDDTIYKLIVKVFNVKGASTLKIVVEDEQGNLLYDNKGNEPKVPVFTNSYSANGEIVLKGIKNLSGHALAAGQFSFELYEGALTADEIASLKPMQTVENTGTVTFDHKTYSAAFEFEALPYTMADLGISTYTIVEKKTNKLTGLPLPGYTYDSAIYHVEVEVSDKDDNGKLTTAIKGITQLKNQDQKVKEAIEFYNNYFAEGEASITAKKTLKGTKLSSNMFSFVLMDESGKTILQTAYNDANGNIIFEDIQYDLSDLGTHKYLLREVMDNKTGFIYDESEYLITVEVTDNGDGTLNTAIIYANNSGEGASLESVEFINEYLESSNGSNVATGDTTPVIFYGALALISLAAVVLLTRKKSKLTK